MSQDCNFELYLTVAVLLCHCDEQRVEVNTAVCFGNYTKCIKTFCGRNTKYLFWADRYVVLVFKHFGGRRQSVWNCWLNWQYGKIDETIKSTWRKLRTRASSLITSTTWTALGSMIVFAMRKRWQTTEECMEQCGYRRSLKGWLGQRRRM